MVMARTDNKTVPPFKPKPLPKPPEQKPPMERKDDFAKKDANGDDKLNADEFNQDRGLLDKLTDPKKFDRYDADNDGYVTRGENTLGQVKDAIGEFKKSKVGLPDFKKAEEAPKDAPPSTEATPI